MLPILTNPNKELRKQSEPVLSNEILDPAFQNLIEEMILVLKKEKNGVGLAAPQIGIHKRIILVETKQGTSVHVNPKIISASASFVESEEGCFSVPNVFGIVRRHKKIKIKSFDREGNKQQFTVTGFESIIFQHEIDHLDGILFIDKVIRYTSSASGTI